MSPMRPFNSKYKVKLNEDECYTQSLCHVHCHEKYWLTKVSCSVRKLFVLKLLTVIIGVVCFRGFLPVLLLCNIFQFIIMAIRTSNKMFKLHLIKYEKKYKPIFKIKFTFSFSFMSILNLNVRRVKSIIIHVCMNGDIFKKRLHHKPCYLKRLQDEKMLWKL